MRFMAAVVVMCALATAAASGAAATTFREPAGFGKATFGMSLAAVTKVYPKLHPAKIMGAAAGNEPRMLMIHELDDQRVGMLRGCRVEFRFFNDALFEIQFHCPERIKVGEFLQKTYGDPMSMDPKVASWKGEHVVVAIEGATGIFAYSDVRRRQEFEKALAEYSKKTPAAPAAPPHE